VSNWFNENRGLALGVSLIGTGVSGALTKVYAGWLIGEFGWRVAYLGVGALPLLIAFPVAWFAFRDIDDPKVARKAAAVAELETHHTRPRGVYGLTLGQAFFDWRFWLLIAVFLPLSFAIGGPIPNLETLLGAKGFDVADAVLLASFIGYSVFAGRLIGGYLLDHMWAPLLACIMLMMPALSMYLLQYSDIGFAHAALAVILLGVAAGIEYDLIAYLVSRYFGIRNYAAIYGMLYASFAVGSGFGPALFGWFYANRGSYDAILEYSMYAFIACSLALLLLGRYRDEKLRSMVTEATPVES
jgi:predicted MFS family arabinose efflux permease